jgi:ABC-type transport system involved in cytochrome c biogenesis permease subunit
MIPPYPALVTTAGWLLWTTFVLYLLASILYVSGSLGKRLSQGAYFTGSARRAGTFLMAGSAVHIVALVTRGIGAGHWPTGNMYEFIGFMAFTAMLAYQVIHRLYDLPLLGALVTPVGVILLGYAFVFPARVVPLVPALRSIWLTLHVSMVALGEGFFAVAFGAALLYLLRVRGLELAAEVGEQPVITPVERRERAWGKVAMESLLYLVLVMVGFTLLSLTFNLTGLQWLFDTATYHLPPIIGPVGEAIGSKGYLFGILPMPLLPAPFNWRGKNLNTLLYALAVGGLLYWLIRRYLTKEPIGDSLARRVGGDPELLDEISYRTVAIGYPIFTLGALVFAMIWAKQAWGRYWFWDPKETWAFITWLVYTVYLHFRITMGWSGRRSAWIVVLGFCVTLFTLVGVNLLIVGLHSYAGGDM